MSDAVRLTHTLQWALLDEPIDCVFALTNGWALSMTFTLRDQLVVFWVTGDEAAFFKCLRYYIEYTGDETYGQIDSITKALHTLPALCDLYARGLAQHALQCLATLLKTSGDRPGEHATYVLCTQYPDWPDDYSHRVMHGMYRVISENSVFHGADETTKVTWMPVDPPFAVPTPPN
jgi:hypothetical protein